MMNNTPLITSRTATDFTIGDFPDNLSPRALKKYFLAQIPLIIEATTACCREQLAASARAPIKGSESKSPEQAEYEDACAAGDPVRKGKALRALKIASLKKRDE